MAARGYRWTIGATALLLGFALTLSACATTRHDAPPPRTAEPVISTEAESAVESTAATVSAEETPPLNAADVAVAAPGETALGSPDDDAALAQSLALRAWQLVLSSVHTAEAAEQESARLLSKGLEVVIESAQAKGRQVYRLTFGAFETREEAQRALDDQRHRPGFERAWVLLRQ